MITTYRFGKRFSEESRIVGRKMRRATQLSAAPPVPRCPARSRRWGVILAGGDGSRLQELTRFIYGDNRPKQFCTLLGEEALVELARKRAQRSIPSEQTIFALTRAHEPYYLPHLAHTVCQTLVQPSNKGTTPPILYSLLRIAQADPQAYVAILPSDHYYSDEDAFTRALDSAFEIAAADPNSVVLLGAHPSGPETEYGWIELGPVVREGLFQTHGFHEKPARSTAERLLRDGALWNTFVMVGHVQAFLQTAASAVPGLLNLLDASMRDVNLSSEGQIPGALYDAIPPCDFSRQVLALSADRLLSLRLEKTEWHDLGHPERVMSTVLAKNKIELPGWVKAWHTNGREVPIQHETILLVEDDGDIRAFTQILLERVGYRVLTAADGGEGLRTFETHQAAIALLLTDLRMPVMNGRDLADHVRQIDANVPVLLMTGDGHAAADGYEFIEKPLKPAELIGHVDRVLKSSNGRKEIARAVIAS